MSTYPLIQTTHRNLVNVLVASDVVWPVSASKTPVTLAFLPFYHMYGQSKIFNSLGLHSLIKPASGGNYIDAHATAGYTGRNHAAV